jgi:hypothetical protein
MINVKILAIACALVAVSGCATLQEMPPPNASTGTTVCRAPVNGQQAMLCDTLGDIQDRSEAYIGRHTRVAGERTAVQGLTLAAGLAGGGFAAFDAHDDNIEAAGIIAAGGLLLDRGLNMRSRVDILRSGALSMNCFASVGVTFAHAQSIVTGRAGGQDITLPLALNTAIESLSSHLATGRDALAAPVVADSPNADQAARTALTLAITQGQTVLADLIKAQRALSRAPDELERAWRSADVQVLTRLAGARPDLAALVREAQQLSADLANPAPGAGSAPTGSSGQDATDLSAIAANINTQIRTAERLDPGRYIAAYEQIAQCKAQAAA